jgi:hypothetical protein
MKSILIGAALASALVLSGCAPDPLEVEEYKTSLKIAKKLNEELDRPTHPIPYDPTATHTPIMACGGYIEAPVCMEF